MSADSERRARTQGRAEWPGTLTTLEGQSDAALVEHTTPGERVAMVWQITLDAWASSGKPMPEHTRANMPGRLLRKGSGQVAERPQLNADFIDLLSMLRDMGVGI